MATNAAAMPQLGAQELPAVQAQPAGIGVGELVDARLDPLLGGALPGRQILAVGDDLGRNRRCRRCRLGACDEALFAFAEPNTHRFPPSLLRSLNADRCAHEAARAVGYATDGLDARLRFFSARRV